MFAGDSGENIEANKSMVNSPTFPFDALLLPDGSEATKKLADNEHTMAFVIDQFRHCKTILALGAGRKLLEMTGIVTVIDEDEGILLAEAIDAADIAPSFITAVAAHRHYSRNSDPAIK